MLGIEENKVTPKHYYGDEVRACYLLGGLIMAVTLPFFINRLPIPLFGAIFVILFIGFFAGLTNPRRIESNIFDVAISFIAFCVFEFYAVTIYLSHSLQDGFVWVNELLAVIFFVAFYYAVKTVRGFYVERKSEEGALPAEAHPQKHN